MPTSDTLKAGVVQMAPVWLDCAKTLDKFAAYWADTACIALLYT